LENNPFYEIDQLMVGDIYTRNEVQKNLFVLCDVLGARFAGSAEEKRAADFLSEKLLEYGLPLVEQEAVTYTGWRRGEARLEILYPIKKTIPCITLPHSPPTDITADIVDLSDGAPEDFEMREADLPGKFALTTSVTYPPGSRRWVHRHEKYDRAMLAGATGFIFINHYPGYGPATGSIGPDNPQSGPAVIPGISISKENGAYLKRLLKQHGRVQLHLTSSDEYFAATSWNVIGELPGELEDAEVVMLGCHYDGHDIAQGAGDPVSGVTALMDAARVLAAYAPPLPHTIRFALWSAEEIGLLGSTQYVLQHDQELDLVRFYLNMDGAGEVSPKDILINVWPELVAPFTHFRDQMALSFEIGQSLNAHSDHYPFMLAGVPTGGIGSLYPSPGGRGYGHTMFDTVDKVERRGMREAAALAARLALRMASESTWPAHRRTQSAVQEILDSPEYHEEQELATQVREYLDSQKAE
jgi:Zn-dependent M28 family amino/carboxypeptidase